MRNENKRRRAAFEGGLMSISLRKSINDNCKDCIFDNLAAGTWLQQVTLCSAESCHLWKVRPQSKAEIPKNVLSYYQVAKKGTSQGFKANLGVVS